MHFDPTIREPYSIQYSLGVERQLAKRTSLAVTYNGSRGIGLFRSRNINAPPPPDYTVIPDPTIGVLRNIESSGRQAGNSLEVTLRGKVTHYVTGLVQYTLSRTSNNTGGVAWFPANQYDLSGEWSRADFDQRHRLNLLESFSPGKQFTFGVGVQLEPQLSSDLVLKKEVRRDSRLAKDKTALSKLVTFCAHILMSPFLRTALFAG